MSASGDTKAAENSNSQISPADEEPEHIRKLFIGGLSLNTTDEGLKQYYAKWGAITDCIVMRDPSTKKSRGFGFVTFQTRHELDKAMEERPHIIDEKQVDPKRAVPRELSSRGEANISTSRLYVSGVREEHTQEVFQQYFKEFGAVTKVEIIQDKTTNKPRGFGFVTFDDYDAVDKCVLKKSHMIAGFRCDVKKALSKDEMARAQQMERDRMERGSRMRGGPRGGPPGPWNMRGGPGGAGGFREPHGGYGGGGPWNQGPPGQWGGQPWGGDFQGYGGGGGGGGYGYGGQGGWGQDGWGGGPGGGNWGSGGGGGYGGSGGPQGGQPPNSAPAGYGGQGGGWSQGGSKPDRNY